MPGTFPTITCAGAIGAADPVAIVEIDPPLYVLRDYADPVHPRSVCKFSESIDRLIDARHVVVQGTSPGASDNTPVGLFAVVDLPDVTYHWFELPAGSSIDFAISPQLDQVAWLASGFGNDADVLHVASSAGDSVVTKFPDPKVPGPCAGEPPQAAVAYSHSGSYLSVLGNSLLVVKGRAPVMNLAPPTAGWATGAQPHSVLWSPVTETLYYAQGGSVWSWTEAGGAHIFLPSVDWSSPTISADGRYVAYDVVASTNRTSSVYLVSVATGLPRLVAQGRAYPAFLNSNLLWYRGSGTEYCTVGAPKQFVYDINDGVESPSSIYEVQASWPAVRSRL